MAKSLNFFKAGNKKSKMQVSVSHDLKRLYSLSANRIQTEIDKLPKDGGSSDLNRRRLIQLQLHINEIIDDLSNETEEIIKDSLLKVNEELVEEQKNWLRSNGFKAQAVNMAFASVPEEMVERMVAGEIYEGGWNLSDAIWGDNDYTKKDLYSIVAQGMVENKGLYEIASDLERYVNPNKITMWNLKMTDGRRIFKKKVEYNAQRLARTLMQHSYQQEVIETTKDNPFIKEWVWVANGSRACPICKERDGTVYTDPDDIPMDHPNGMCVIDVVESNTFADDLRDWYHAEDGEYPEIDEFAKKFGYEPNAGMQSVTKQDVIDIKRVEEKSATAYDLDFFKENEKVSDMFDKLNMTESEKDRFFASVENADVEYRRALYRSIERVETFRISDEASSWNSIAKALQLTSDALTSHSQASGIKVLFHELGHAMDDLQYESKTGKWQSSAEEVFQRAIFEDIYNIKDILEENIGKRFMLKSWDSVGVQDVVGGLRHFDEELDELASNFRFNTGHSDSYWTGNIKDPQRRQERIFKQSGKELFAHFSSAEVNSEEKEYMIRYFPETYSVFKSIIKEIL